MHDADPDGDEDDRPHEERDLEPLEDVISRPCVTTTGPEDVVAEDNDADGPDGEREGDRDRRETENVARLPVAPHSTGGTHAEVYERAHEEIDGEPVQTAGDERPHGEAERVELEVVESARRDVRAEYARDPRKPDDREQRLLPRLGGVA